MIAFQDLNSEEKESDETYLLPPRSIRRKNSIRFSTIETRQFNRTLGDNPACTEGPPISLDWDYIDAGSIPIDEYEAKRFPRRSLEELFLSTFTRRRIMSANFEYTIKELETAEKSVKKIQKSRLKEKNQTIQLRKNALKRRKKRLS